MKKRNMIATSLAVVLAVALLAGGTFTYLTDSSEEVVNEFTTNKNGVDLEETTGDEYDIVPGTSQEKDPTITATYTLDSYVFVEVTDATDDLVTWYIANGWTLLSTTDNTDGSTTYVYYQLLEYDETEAVDGVCTTELHVLEGDQVYYSSTLTNDDLENADDISLTFQAYIIQAEPFANAGNAWLVVSGQGVAVNETTGVVYATLAEALSAVNSGDLIALLQDVTESAITISNDVTLDLGGYTLTANLTVNNGAELTLVNGTVSGYVWAVASIVGDGTSLTLKDVDVTTASTAVYAYGANVTIDGGSVTSTSVEAVRAETGSYVEISNSTVTAATNAVIAQNSEITVSNSEISGGTSEYKVEGNGSITIIDGSSTTTYDSIASYVVLEDNENLATQLTAALKTATAGASVAVVLPEDARVSVSASVLQAAVTGTAEVDLNGGELTVTNDSGTVTLSDSVDLTIANGKVIANNSTETTKAAFNIQSGSSLTLENVTLTTDGCGLYPQGDAAKVNVINSTITTSGAYCVATNAATMENYNVVISIENSTLTASSDSGDNCAVLVNIPCTLSITDSIITGDRQGVIVRGGTATITDSSITTTGKFVTSDATTNTTRLNGTWSSGNEVPSAALEVGNYQSSAYAYVTTVTLDGVTLTVQTNTDLVPAIYAASCGYTTTLTGASSSDTVLARVNTGTASINGTSISTIETMTTVGDLSTGSSDE